MLNQYLQQTQRLLNDVTQATFNIYDLTTYINSARSQVAGESEAIRNLAVLPLVSQQQAYPFSAIQISSQNGSAAYSTVDASTPFSVTGVTLTSPGAGYISTAPSVYFFGGSGSGAAALATVSAGTVSAVSVSAGGTGYLTAPQVVFTGGGGNGISGVLSVRLVTFPNAGSTMENRAWEWFSQFFVNTPTPQYGIPARYSQYAQGVNGSLYFNPIPETSVTNSVQNLLLDCVCYPIALAVDTDPEAIPYPWTDAIPYFAAYLALLNVQQLEGAASMFNQYELFTKRGRQISTPTVLPNNYSGTNGARMVARQALLTGEVNIGGGNRGGGNGQ